MSLTLRQLQVIEYQLTERDKAILNALRNAKNLFTYHIRRIFFTDAANPQAGARTANRNLKKLRELGLIDAMMDRRIGGVRAGSSSYIWYLTEQGNRLLDMDKKYPDEDGYDTGTNKVGTNTGSKTGAKVGTKTKAKRFRFTEPADVTLGHRMAIAECWVQLEEIAREGDSFTIKEVVFEPTNWQYYNYQDRQEVLKPDLAIVVSHHGNEYRFLIEIDLNTEPVKVVMGKCIRYLKYLQSGEEQKLHGVFPAVLWIVHKHERKKKLEEAMRRELAGQPSIFIVITADEFHDLITAEYIPRERLL